MFWRWLNKQTEINPFPCTIKNYFSLKIVSVTEFPEEHSLQVNVAITIWMDRATAGDLVQKYLNMQDKWQFNVQ